MTARWTFWHSLGLFGLLTAVVVIDATPFATFQLAFYLTLGVMVALAIIIGHGVTGDPRGILIDENNRISLSRFQLVVWTLVLLSGILTAALGNLFRHLPCGDLCPLLCTGPNQPKIGALDFHISANVWALMGITLTSAVTAALVNQTNRRRNRAILGHQSANEASWADLFVATEGPEPHVDITRVQNFYFTVILVIAYTALLQQLFAAGQFICSFPELTTGMLTILAISHTGYIVSKMVPK